MLTYLKLKKGLQIQYFGIGVSQPGFRGKILIQFSVSVSIKYISSKTDLHFEILGTVIIELLTCL